MKKIIQYLIFGLVIVFIYGKVDAFAQAKWVPRSIEIKVPAILTHTISGFCTNSGIFDSLVGEQTKTISLGFLPGDSITNYSRSENTISMIRHDQWSGATTITFDLDSINSNLLNFVLNFHGGGPPFGDDYETITMSTVHYTLSHDSLIEVNDSGVTCMNNISKVSFVNGVVRLCNGGNYTEKLQFDHLLPDTISYLCSITLVIPQLLNTVGELIKSSKVLTISNSLPDPKIHFSFSSAGHSLTLTIYDILGREVKRIEIPSGVSEYRLQRDGFMNGYYFARLGSQTAKFVVN